MVVLELGSSVQQEVALDLALTGCRKMIFCGSQKQDCRKKRFFRWILEIPPAVDDAFCFYCIES